MKQFPGRQLRCWAMGSVVWGILTAGGCGTGNPTLRERLGMLGDGRLDSPIRKNLIVTGGIEAWEECAAIDGEALVTTFGPNSSQTIMEQQHRIDPDGKIGITVTTVEPQGELVEQLDRQGKLKVEFRGREATITKGDPKELTAAAVRLRLIAQVVTGARGLLQEGMGLRYVAMESLGGRESHKLEASGDLLGRGEGGGDLLVVWIDAETYEFERLWMRYPVEEVPGGFGYLSAQITGYQQVDGGLNLPTHIELVESNEYQLFSQRRVMLIEYHQLEVTKKLLPAKKRFFLF